MSQKSASAIQIEEKEARIDAMEDLSISYTKRQIIEALENNPNLTDEQVIKQVKNEGIKINAFLHSYISSKFLDVKTAVSYRIAQSYFESLSKSLYPRFVTFPLVQGKAHIHFRLKEETIRYLIAEIREVKAKGELSNDMV